MDGPPASNMRGATRVTHQSGQVQTPSVSPVLVARRGMALLHPQCGVAHMVDGLLDRASG